MKILVCEDDPVMLLVLIAVLKKLEYTVISSKDGKQALEMIDKESPDMVITDMVLPYLSGAEIVSYVKNLKGKKIPVIMLSSMPKEVQQFNTNAPEADSYLLKPVLPQQLKNKIEELRLSANRKNSCTLH